MPHEQRVERAVQRGEIWAVRAGPQPLQAGLGRALCHPRGDGCSLHLLPGLVLELEDIWAQT